MSDQAAFLTAIRADPDDDPTRLVYADWLDEHGDERDRARAEFIRAQIELERLEEWSERRLDLEERAIDLFKLHGAGWRAEVPGWVKPHLSDYRRGFLHQFSATPATFIARADELFAAAPVQHGEFRSLSGGGTAKLARCSSLGRLRTIALGLDCTPDNLRSFLASEG
jgi:uncharacterized protein (TIGR02996 family)